MTDKLRALIRYIVAIDDKQLDKIVGCFKPKMVKRNTVLLAEGEVCNEFYYVAKGIVRTYYLTKQGQEKTRFLIFDAQIGTSLSSFIAQQPSEETVDTLEDTELLVISHADFYQLVKDIPEWEFFYRRILEMAYMYQNNKIENRITLSAKQRYEKVLNETPFYIQRLSNKILASFLDITQETLSRLKSK